MHVDAPLDVHENRRVFAGSRVRVRWQNLRGSTRLMNRGLPRNHAPSGGAPEGVLQPTLSALESLRDCADENCDARIAELLTLSARSQRPRRRVTTWSLSAYAALQITRAFATRKVSIARTIKVFCLRIGCKRLSALTCFSYFPFFLEKFV
jgi:hypothetical protein